MKTKQFVGRFDISKLELVGLLKDVQAALVIRGLGIRGFDYPRTVKWVKITDNKGNFYISHI